MSSISMDYFQYGMHLSGFWTILKSSVVLHNLNVTSSSQLNNRQPVVHLLNFFSSAFFYFLTVSCTTAPCCTMFISILCFPLGSGERHHMRRCNPSGQITSINILKCMMHLFIFYFFPNDNNNNNSGRSAAQSLVHVKVFLGKTVTRNFCS